MGHVGTVVNFQREGSISISSAFSETEGHYCFKTIILAPLGYSRDTKLLRAMKWKSSNYGSLGKLNLFHSLWQPGQKNLPGHCVHGLEKTRPGVVRKRNSRLPVHI